VSPRKTAPVQHQLRTRENLIDQWQAEGTRAGARRPEPPKAGGRALSPARDQFAALLPVSERVSGAEHPETLTTRANLAYWTGQAGDAAPELS
jgi:hypothetical protein